MISSDDELLALEAWWALPLQWPHLPGFRCPNHELAGPLFPFWQNRVDVLCERRRRAGLTAQELEGLAPIPHLWGVNPAHGDVDNFRT